MCEVFFYTDFFWLKKQKVLMSTPEPQKRYQVKLCGRIFILLVSKRKANLPKSTCCISRRCREIYNRIKLWWTGETHTETQPETKESGPADVKMSDVDETKVISYNDTLQQRKKPVVSTLIPTNFELSDNDIKSNLHQLSDFDIVEDIV